MHPEIVTGSVAPPVPVQPAHRYQREPLLRVRVQRARRSDHRRRALPGLLLNPIIASAAMTLNSVSIIGDALRLRRVQLGELHQSSSRALLRLSVRHEDDGHRGGALDAPGDAVLDELCDAGASMGRHRDKVGASLLRLLDDLGRGIAEANGGLDFDSGQLVRGPLQALKIIERDAIVLLIGVREELCRRLLGRPVSEYGT